MAPYDERMRELDRVDVQRTVEKIAAGDDEAITRAEVIHLLVAVRERAGRSSMLQDLAHSAAHDERDKGYAFDYLQALVNEMVSIEEGRDAVLRVVVAYPIAAVLRELNEVMKREQIDVQLPLNDERTNLTAASAFGQALNGTTFKLRRAIATMETYPGPRGPRFGLKIEFDGALFGFTGTKIVVPWFLDIDAVTGDTLGT